MKTSVAEEARLDELSRRLRQATHGHVRRFFLDRLGDTLFVHLCTESYYGLQLAIAAVDRLLSKDGTDLSVALSAEVKGVYYRLTFASTGEAGDVQEGRSQGRGISMAAKRARAKAMKRRTIFVTRTDYDRLAQLLASDFAAAIWPRRYLDDLRSELDRAAVVPEDKAPREAVTMNSTVCLRDLDTDETETYTLVYPGKANIAQNRLSVLAPVGTAILGYCVGDVVNWDTPGGTRRLRIEQVSNEPEQEALQHR